MEKVFVVFADTEKKEEEELEFLELVKACDFQIEAIFSQLLKSITLKTYIGSGKCLEIQEALQDSDISYIIFHQDLTPLQIRNLEALFHVPVMDRSELILAIFSRRAKSPAAKLQIESAQLKKMLPRLIGSNTQLSRQGGSGFNKGSGEKQLELDRRRIKSRISEVDRELKKLATQRKTQRKAREKNALPLVALVGYTNAGKSTILNRVLTHCKGKEEKKVLEKDMLFATLDTSIRQIQLPHGHSFLLSDTVGFISHLPHELIKAFHFTLEEVRYADLLLQVVDASSKQHNQHIDITMDTLRQIGAADIPMLIIYNKCDKTSYTHPQIQDHHLYLCAKDDKEVDYLIQKITETLFPEKKVEMFLPYTQYNIYSYLKEHAHILKEKQEEEGISICLYINDRIYKKYKDFIQKVFPE